MLTPQQQTKMNKTTEIVIGCAFDVHNTLKDGYWEQVYENALVHDLRKVGLNVVQQAPLVVHYDSIVVGEYVADLLIEGCIIVELKAVRTLDKAHVAQCINYLKTTGYHVCLLLNFAASKVQVKRLVRDF